MLRTPTQSTPAGCFVATLGLFPLAASGLGAYGLYRWFLLPVEHRHFDQRFWLLLAAFIGGTFITFLMLTFGIKLLRSSKFRNYDFRDPKEPNLKW